MKLKIATWNICLGMFRKMNMIKQIIHKNQIDILFLNETDIKEHHDMSMLQLKDYDLQIIFGKSRR